MEGRWWFYLLIFLRMNGQNLAFLTKSESDEICHIWQNLAHLTKSESDKIWHIWQNLAHVTKSDKIWVWQNLGIWENLAHLAKSDKIWVWLGNLTIFDTSDQIPPFWSDMKMIQSLSEGSQWLEEDVFNFRGYFFLEIWRVSRSKFQIILLTLFLGLPPQTTSTYFRAEPLFARNCVKILNDN